MGKIKSGIRAKLGIFMLFLFTGIVLWNLSLPRGVLVAEGPAKVVSKPFPVGYGERDLQDSNEILRILQPGEQIKYINFLYDKDFAYYVVKVNGQKAYIISGEPVRKVD